jgi:hypothetical protein
MNMNMNTTFFKRCLPVAAAIALGTLGASSWAATTWSVLDGCTTNTVSSPCGATGVAVTGWSTSTGATSFVNGAFTAATVVNYGSTAGLGVTTPGDPTTTGPHAIDNTYGIDALLIKFTGGATNLTTVNIGWNGSDDGSGGAAYSDSDLSVYAWIGGANGPVSGSNLLSTGWSLVGNYADVGLNAGNAATVSTSKFSSYWLISAYSTAYGVTGGTATSGFTAGNDSFKVLSVAGNTCVGAVQCGTNQTPEPGSLALLGAGVVGLLAARRRKATR